METLVALIVSILPVYFVLLYTYRKDNYKEPKKLLKKLFIYGMIICIPVALFEIEIGKLFPNEDAMNLSMLFAYVLIDVGLIEEFGKWLVVYRVTYNHYEFDQIYDAIVYAVFVSLGFACLENVAYVLTSGIGVGFFRAVTAIPGHASDAIMMGYYLGLAKLAEVNGNRGLRIKNLSLSIVMPVLLHTIYDYCLFTENILFILIFIAFVIFIYVYSIKKIKRVSMNNHRLTGGRVVVKDGVKYCAQCGTKCYGNYCHHCGNKLSI